MILKMRIIFNCDLVIAEYQHAIHRKISEVLVRGKATLKQSTVTIMQRLLGQRGLGFFPFGSAQQEINQPATRQNRQGDEGLYRPLKHDIDEGPTRDAEKNKRCDRIKGDAKWPAQAGLSPSEYKESEYGGEGIERHGGAREDENLLERSGPEKQ